MSNCFIDFYNQFGSITGSIGRMLPLLLVGSFVNKVRGLKTGYVSILLLVSFIGLVVEAFLLKSLGATKFSFIVFTLPLAFFLFALVERLIINIRINTRYLAKASMNVYLIHPAILFILKEIGILSPIALFVMTCVFSVSLCLSVVYIGNNCKGSSAK
jgi:peptidoglycan/LPS O-acetylase OafA/YrhL